MRGESPAAATNDQPQSQQLPSVSLPKGGGAIRGIGEKFASNPVTGTGSMSVPIATSPGRAGFGPELSLSYDSGAGNGPFGFGWRLSLPSITRSTDNGLPQYRDEDDSDVFVLSGAEDLVPALVDQQDGSWKRDRRARTVAGVAYRIDVYRSRVEGLFARIERWTVTDSGETHWRSISRDNVTTLYGRTPESRIADPADPRRVFSWLICETYDDKGNAISYEYAAEDSTGVDPAALHEATRTPTARMANRYPKRIRYGNAVSRLVEPDLSNARWYFEVVFDYLSEPHGGGVRGEHFAELPPDADGRVLVTGPAATPRRWGVRSDPFSLYRPGFELRTYRLCRRVLMLHHFPAELGVEDYLVRSTEFTYDERPIGSFLTSATQSGYVRRPNGRFLKRSLPPVEFEYSAARIDTTVREVEPATTAALPAGLAAADSRWVDLDGDGIAGVLTEHETGWLYRRNESPLNLVRDNGADRAEARFAPAELVASKPTPQLLTGDAQFLDLAGDGQTDLVTLAPPVAGVYERTPDEGWTSFRSFPSPPPFDPRDPNLRFIDLDGDGHADALVTEDEALIWYRSLAEDGFEAARRVPRALDEAKGPTLVFADATESIHLTDLSGDGQSDLVRIRNGEVCYWPNLGHGRFGAKVAMDNAPVFDEPDLFQPRRVHLADIDGSGVTDILYVGGDGVDLYFNQAGNAWSAPTSLGTFPGIDDAAAVDAVDLLGNGTACLVWSSPLPDAAPKPMRYVELMGEGKPHLLVSMKNNLGAETRVRYAPSTRFYLEDKRAGRPWLTRLPFPVHVVERVETYDHVSRNRFVSRYVYHHGCFDGVEREFRGFGLVDRFDTEEFAALSANGDFPVGDNVDAASHVPPVLTRSWFHTGAFLESERVSRLYEDDYYRPPGLTDAAFRALLLPDTTLPDGLDAAEAREACRALQGSRLREEVYGLDGTPEAAHPYRVAERTYTVRALQPKDGNPHAVFFVHEAESVDYHHERIPGDPRVTHSLTLEVDDFGNSLKAANIAYGRRTPDSTLAPADRARQARAWITYVEDSVTNAVSGLDDHRTPLPAASRTFELTGLALASGRVRFTRPEVLAAGTAAAEIPYEQAPSAGVVQKRVVEDVRTLYRRNDLAGPLPLGQLRSLALVHESYKRALTPGLVSAAYGTRVTPSMLEGQGGYSVFPDTPGWWIPSGRLLLAPQGEPELAFARTHFFQPRRYRDAFHSNSAPTDGSVRYDPYDLLVDEAMDALGNRFTAGERGANPDGPLARRGNDYRVLQPSLVMDANGNRSEAAIDALGRVVATALMGKPGETAGDSLAGINPDPTDAEIAAQLADPVADPHALLRRATTRTIYDLFASRRAPAGTRAPAVVYTMSRETHDAELPDGAETAVQHAFTYFDGLGQEIQKKLSAEPGRVPRRDVSGRIVVGPDGAPELTPGEVSPRWITSGWTVFDNKGNPVRQFEPFFSDRHAFEDDVRVGVGAVLFYDAAERVVGTLYPDHTWEKVVFDAWRQETWDRSDTILVADPKTDPDLGDRFDRLPDASFLPTWHQVRKDGALGPLEQAAAKAAAVHAGTPTVVYADALGRAFLTVGHNRFKHSNSPATAPPTEEFHRTRVALDIEGNERELSDARGRIVMRYTYDLVGNRIHAAGMDSGERRVLHDAAGGEIATWDARGNRLRTTYDALRRPRDVLLRRADGSEAVVGRSVYGEARPNPEAANLRGQLFERFDQAGVATNTAYDFKGNLLESRRRLAVAYKTLLDWTKTVPLQPENYVSRRAYDALDRTVQLTAPDGSVIRPRYNEANLLERIDANLRGARSGGQPVWTSFVADIDYDAQGRRTEIEFGNGVRTTHEYDRLSSRLARLVTKRRAGDFPADCPQPQPAAWPGCGLQDLSYTYDAIGNVVHVGDAAQQTVFFRNKRVEANSAFTFDAVGRLIEATGRDHLGQVGAAPAPGSYNDRPRIGVALATNDGNAMARYLERYTYDAAGNLTKLEHRGTDPAHAGWTRTYTYGEPSRLEPAKLGDRLTSTAVGVTTEVFSAAGNGYDAQGHMLRMQQLQALQWDFAGNLRMTRRQAVGPGDTDGTERHGERTWYVYDSSGQRVRKVTETAAGAVRDERIYLDGFELHRRGGPNPLTRETLHIRAGDESIALVETRVDTAAPQQLVRYQLGNHLGSVSLELTGAAQVISYEEYYPYGGTSLQAVRAQTDAPKRYRFTGKERDEESGLYYHGARYYTPWLGRWVSPDPEELVDGPNLYAYCRGNPVGMRDPTGTQGDDPSKQPVRQRRSHAIIVGDDIPGRPNNDRGDADKWLDILLTEPTVERFPERIAPGDHLYIALSPGIGKAERKDIDKVLEEFKTRFTDPKTGDLTITLTVEKVEGKNVAAKVNALENISTLVYLGHGTSGPGPLYGGDFPDPNKFQGSKFAPDAVALWASCNLMDYAKEFTEHTGVMSLGVEGTTWFGRKTITAGVHPDSEAAGTSKLWIFQRDPATKKTTKAGPYSINSYGLPILTPDKETKRDPFRPSWPYIYEFFPKKTPKQKRKPAPALAPAR